MSLDPEGKAAMAKIVKVTPAQVNAAKLKVKRSTATGRYISSSVSAIANARRLPASDPMSPGSGRRVSEKKA
jgi:hypothetical protein